MEIGKLTFMPSKIPFEEMLAQSLECLEQGESIDSCLARYPANASALEPLLRVALTLRYSPQPELGSAAFGRGRNALAAFARQQQVLRRPLINTPKSVALRQRLPASLAPRLPAPTLARQQWVSPRYASLLVSVFLLISLVALLRTISISLPGGSLYRVKLLSENMQGVFSLAAGDRAAWFARQSERRLQEAFQLTQQQQAVTPELLQAIDENLQATLAATADIPADQRNDFLLAWLGRLQQLEADAPVAQAGVETLHQAIAQVEAAISITSWPTLVPTVSLPTNSPTPSATVEATSTLPVGTALNAMPTPTAEVVDAIVTLPEPLATATEVPTIAVFKTLLPTATVPVATLAPALTPQDFDNAVAQPSNGNGSGGGGGSSNLPNQQPENPQPKPTQFIAPNSVPNTPTWTPTSVMAVVAPMPTLTETQAITITPTGVASGTGTATATRSATLTPTDERTPTPAATSGTGTATPITTATETTGTPTPTERPTETPSFTLEPTGITPVTPAGTDIPTPVSRETPTPEEFFTVTPTNTPQATEVATPTEVATEYTREPTWTPAETVTPTEAVAPETPTPQATNPPEPTAAPTSETPAPATKPGRHHK